MMNIHLRQVGGNALSILSSDVLNRATSFVLYALVARHLGAFEFGQLSLALTLFYVFQVFAVSGVKVLTVRQVAKDRSQTGKYFVNGCLIVSTTSVASLAVLFAFLRFVHYAASTNLVILLLSLALLPYAISAICEAIFQAWERMKYIAYVNVPANIAKMVGAYLLLSGNRGLRTVILVLLATFFTVAAVELCLVLRRFPGPKASIDIPFALATLRSAATFLGIDGTVAIESSLNVVFLSKFATVKEVGLYSSAAQLLVPLLLVYSSIAQSIFPLMCRKVAPGYQALRRIAEQATQGLLVLALPMVAGIFFLGEGALTLLYKNRAFLEAVPALRIMAWTLILQVFTFVLGQVLLATHRERITFRITVVDLLVNLSVGPFLIWHFGLIGAAFTLLLTRFTACVQHLVPVIRLLSGLSLGRIIWKPVLAAGCMAAYLAFAAPQEHLIPAAASATLIYAAAFLAVAVLACGGLREFKSQFFYTWYGSASRETGEAAHD